MNNIKSKIPFSSGKIRTTKEENIKLQTLFINEGYSFLNGNKEVKVRDDLDFFYFENNFISLGGKNDIHTNANPFNFKMWDGETYFLKKKIKERVFSDFLKFM